MLTFIPLIFFIGSSLLSYWTHGLFVIDQVGNYHRGKFLPFYFFILFAYIPVSYTHLLPGTVGSYNWSYRLTSFDDYKKKLKDIKKMIDKSKR